jgi:hypothetical protein
VEVPRDDAKSVESTNPKPDQATPTPPTSEQTENPTPKISPLPEAVVEKQTEPSARDLLNTVQQVPVLEKESLVRIIAQPNSFVGFANIARTPVEINTHFIAASKVAFEEASNSDNVDPRHEHIVRNYLEAVFPLEASAHTSAQSANLKRSHKNHSSLKDFSGMDAIYEATAEL